MTTTQDVAAEVARQLAADLRGEVITPNDASYETHRRVWNGSIDRRPGLIARVAGAADVVSAVKVARAADIRVALRGGGHSFPGHSTCDDGMVIDTSLMKGIRIDLEKRTVRAQAGVLLGELDRETQAFGMIVPAGIVTHTGLAGLTLGGGIGWLTRKLGLTIDQLLSVDMVTANGDLITASASENADLFWGVRGAGGNFGVVTEFEFKLNTLGPQVLAGPIFWPMSESPRLLRFYREWIPTTPDDLMTIVIHRKAPALPFVPQEWHGKPVAGVVCCYSGEDLDKGEEVLRPLKSFGAPVMDLCVPKPFLTHQAMFDPSFPHGWWYYFRAFRTQALTDEVIDITGEHAIRIESPLTAFPIWHLGGAMSRVGEDETAFSGRQEGFEYNINCTTETEAGFDRERQWVRDFSDALASHQQGVYVNFLMEEGEARVRQSYGDAKYERLKALKRKYDPDNFFRLNQNIRPD